MNKAIVKDGVVINVIDIKTGSKWLPPEGCILLTALQSENAGKGDTWDGVAITKVIPVEEETISPIDIEAELLLLKDRVDELSR